MNGASPSLLAGSLLAATLLAACAPARVGDAMAPNDADGIIITREQIEKSGARDGWEALRRAATHLKFQYTRQGTDVKVTHRGVDSFLLDPQVLLVLDGAHVQGLSILETILARNIDYIQVLPGRVGVVRYGTSAGHGVVVVKTGVPPAMESPLAAGGMD